MRKELCSNKTISQDKNSDFEEIYKRLDINLVERGESYYQSRMQATVQEFEQARLLNEEDGSGLQYPISTDKCHFQENSSSPLVALFPLPLSKVMVDSHMTQATWPQ